MDGRAPSAARLYLENKSCCPTPPPASSVSAASRFRASSNSLARFAFPVVRLCLRAMAPRSRRMRLPSLLSSWVLARPRDGADRRCGRWQPEAPTAIRRTMVIVVGRRVVQLGGPHEPPDFGGFEVTTRTDGGTKREGHATGGQVLDHHIRSDGINECTD